MSLDTYLRVKDNENVAYILNSVLLANEEDWNNAIFRKKISRSWNNIVKKG